VAEVPKARRVPAAPKTVEGGRYTQINILFPSGEVELPAADRFSAYPPEAQKAILEAFQREQIERHAWLKTQQSNDHALNTLDQKHFFIWRLVGTLTGGLLTLSTIALGAWLVAHDASATGVSMMIAAAAGLVGTAIYGQRALSAQTPEKEKPSKKEG
jgi:hypothetical protein